MRREETDPRLGRGVRTGGPRGGAPLRPRIAGGQPARTAPRHPRRRQGHHRRPGAVDPLRNAGLPGDRPRRGRPGHRPPPECGGDLPGKDGDDPLRQQRPHDHPESLESRAHAGRIEQRLRRRRGGPDVPAGPGHADGGLAPPARRLQRDRRLQGDLRRGEQRGGPAELLEHRPRRRPLPVRGRRRDPLALHPREGAPPVRPDAGAAPPIPHAGFPARRRAWGTSGSFSRRRPPPRSWRTSPPSGKSSSRPAPRSSRSPCRPPLPSSAPAGASSSRRNSTPTTGTSSRPTGTSTRRSSRSAWRRGHRSPATSTSNTSATGSSSSGRCARKWPMWMR